MGSSSVVSWSRGPALAVWLAHGENDEVFPANDARKVAEALRAAGVEVRLDVFPGRGHSFGEDQPLLVRRAAEFCAEALGGAEIVPVNVRPAGWFYWLPVALLFAWGGFRLAISNRGSRCELALTFAKSRWSGLTSAATRIMAGVVLVSAVLVSAAHLALPLLPVNTATLRLARQWNVRLELRTDFDWLVSQPEAKNCRLRDLLEHLNLAALQRGPFAAELPEDDWREFVLSPWIDGAGEEIGWRRELWEWMAPRVRRETSSQQAAVQIARELRLRVGLFTATPGRVIASCWRAGRAGENEMQLLEVAALRAGGIAARVKVGGDVEILAEDGWRLLPRALVLRIPSAPP